MLVDTKNPLEIDRKKIKDRIKEFSEKLAEENHSLPKTTFNEFFIFGKVQLPYYESRKWFHLEDIISKRNRIQLSSNGFIHIGMDFDSASNIIKRYLDPEKLENLTDSEINDGNKFLPVRILKFGDRYLREIVEPHRNIYRGACYTKFFHLETPFASLMVEPGYGFRMDKNSEIGGFFQELIDRKIPTFIDTIDFNKLNYDKFDKFNSNAQKFVESNKAYVINAINV